MSNKDDITKSLQSLVDDGTLTNAQRDAVVHKLAGETGPIAGKSLKGLLSEAFVYLGGAVIVGSGALLISQTWNDLGRWGRFGVLVLAAVLLWVAGFIIRQKKKDEEGRRLTSTLLTGGAVLVGVACQTLLSDLWIPRTAQGYEDWAAVQLWVEPAQIVISMSVAVLIAALGYRLSHSALALVVTGGAALGVAMSSGQLINYVVGPDTPRDQQFIAPMPWLAPTLTALGSLLWLFLWKKNVFKEVVIAHLLGLIGLFTAVNSFREYYNEDTVSSILVFVGLIGLAMYVQSHLWPYLVFGLGSILMGGIQMLFKYVEGVGGALASMALGAVLVGVGIWLVRERKAKPAH